MTDIPDVNFIEPSCEEIAILSNIDEKINTYCIMSKQDKNFLNSLILRKKPKKILEIGVLSGGSSLLILNALKNYEGAHLYSHDYSKQCWADRTKTSGYLVKEFPEFQDKWTLYLDGFVSNYLDEIGEGIDFCLIDTAHVLPGEILDFLMVLPYLKNDATVVFHDTSLHLNLKYRDKRTRHSFATGLLMSAISGKKFLPLNKPFSSDSILPNIGATEIDQETRKHIFEIFNLLTMDWYYMISDKDIKDFEQCLNRFYPSEYSILFKKILEYQSFNIKEIKKEIFTEFIQEIKSKLNNLRKHSHIIQNFSQKLYLLYLIYFKRYY